LNSTSINPFSGMHRPLLLTLLLALPAPAGDCDRPIDVPPAKHPADCWEFAFESGYLWNVGNNTSIDYEIAPTQFTFRSPGVWTWWEDENGARLVFRHRFSLLMESIVEGPEDHYFGVSGAPSIEYWFPSRKTSLFFSVGGGFGWTNSTNIPGGQGQDFTFNWFSQLGLRQSIGDNVSLLVSGYFTHMSNMGQTNPNPGIDAFGFTAGLGWTF